MYLRTIERSIFEGTILETFFSSATDLNDEISFKISYNLIITQNIDIRQQDETTRVT